jgi:hypothetical protein
MGSSSYSGFMNVGIDDEPILMDNETAIEMIKAMVRGKEAEVGAQSAFYTRQPGTGGTGIEEGSEWDGVPSKKPGMWDGKPSEKNNKTFPSVAEKINEQSDEELARSDLAAQKTIAKNAIKRLENQRDAAVAAAGEGKAQATQAISQQEEQLQQLNQQISEKKREYTSSRSNLIKMTEMFQEMPVDTDEQVQEKQEVLEQIYELREKAQSSKESINDLRKQRNTMQKTIQQSISAQTSQPSVTKQFDQQIRDARKALAQVGKGTVAETLLKQYEKERNNVNLMEQMDMYNETTRGSLQKFFEMFEDGKTNEEVIQHYAKNGITIPESFAAKVKKQFESYKKLKLELGFSEQEAKDFKKSIVPKEEIKKLSTKIFKK